MAQKLKYSLMVAGVTAGVFAFVMCWIGVIR